MERLCACSPGSPLINQGLIPSSKLGIRNSTCSSGCRPPASVRAICFSQIQRYSARCLGQTRVCKTFGATSRLRADAGRTQMSTTEKNQELELDDIQSGVLRPRPAPFVGTYIVLRIEDRKAGQQLMQKIADVVTSAAHPSRPTADTWVSVALTYQGLKALGVPQQSLDSFSWEFRQGM